MVSRFPGGSPINLETEQSERFLLAEFNREFTAEELVGKLKAVLFYGGDTWNAVAEINTYFTPAKLVLRYDDGAVFLEIEGNKLYANNENDNPYIFDLDYDGQHLKHYEQSEANYLLQIPLLIKQNNVPQYLIVFAGADSVSMWVNDFSAANYQPEGADAELTDVDVCDWFNEESGESNAEAMQTLLKEILVMEYGESLRGFDYALSSVSESGGVTVDGGFWNPFTDGAPYRPVAQLQMTSRMPNGLPVEVAQGRRLLATYNRALTMQELVGKLNAVFAYETPAPATVAQLLSIEVTSLYEGIWRSLDGEQAVLLYIEGSNLYVETAGFNDGHIFDVDYNQQHRRALTMQASPDPLLYYINMPTLSPSILNDKICIYVYADDVNYFQLVKMPSSGDLAVYDGSHMPPQGIQADKQHLLSILMGILKLEFTGSQDWDIDIVELSQDTTTMVGGVNLFEVSAMPAP